VKTPSKGLALQGYAMIAQLTIHSPAQNMTRSGSGILRTIFQALAQYPLLTTTVTDLAGKAILAIAEQQQGWRSIAATGLWSNTDLGVICKDENVLSWIKVPQQQPAAMPGPQV
jgi:hypothetical protein